MLKQPNASWSCGNSSSCNLSATKVNASSRRFHVPLSILVWVLSVWRLFFKSPFQLPHGLFRASASLGSLWDVISPLDNITLIFYKCTKEELDPHKKFIATGKEIFTLRIVSNYLRATYALLYHGFFLFDVSHGYMLHAGHSICPTAWCSKRLRQHVGFDCSSSLDRRCRFPEKVCNKN